MNTSLIRSLLLTLFSAIILCMLYVTIRASLVRNVFDNGDLLEDPWFIATLMDAYFGFLTFFVWVCWKEPRWSLRVLWFVLIMALGNFAMAAYVIMQILRTPNENFFTQLLSSRNH